MLIWGSKGREKKIGKGEFYCPNCQRRCEYVKKRLARDFTLYFIPIFQTKNYGEFIECQVCGTPYETEILEYSQKAQEEARKIQKEREKLLANIKKELEAGLPIQLLYNSMLESGISEENVKIILYAAVEGRSKACKKCELVYIDTLNYCANCGNRLVKIDDE